MLHFPVSPEVEQARSAPRSTRATALRKCCARSSHDRPLNRRVWVSQCAVARLTLRDGVAAIDRSIAVETRQIAVSASGEINLARQTLSLAFRPQVKRGLDLNPGSLVELMLLQGPLDAPELSINPRGAVHQAANVGVAAATGGISLLAPALRAAAGEPSACAQAASPGRPQAGPGGAPAKREPRGPIRRKLFGG